MNQTIACMKPALLIAILLPLSATVYSQQSSSLLLSMEAKRKLQEKNRLPIGADTSQPGTYLKLMDLQRLKKGGLINATWSHNTARGKVYKLTPDNMPCLVPDQQTAVAMPNGFKGVNPDKKMNRIPEVRIIPLAGEAKPE